jgi:hypothetical protein
MEQIPVTMISRMGRVRASSTADEPRCPSDPNGAVRLSPHKKTDGRIDCRASKLVFPCISTTEFA